MKMTGHLTGTSILGDRCFGVTKNETICCKISSVDRFVAEKFKH